MLIAGQHDGELPRYRIILGGLFARLDYDAFLGRARISDHFCIGLIHKGIEKKNIFPRIIKCLDRIAYPTVLGYLRSIHGQLAFFDFRFAFRVILLELFDVLPDLVVILSLLGILQLRPLTLDARAQIHQLHHTPVIFQWCSLEFFLVRFLLSQSFPVGIKLFLVLQKWQFHNAAALEKALQRIVIEAT